MNHLCPACHTETTLIRLGPYVSSVRCLTCSYLDVVPTTVGLERQHAIVRSLYHDARTPVDPYDPDSNADDYIIEEED